MPAAASRRWTAAEVRELPDEPGKHFEVIDGELFVSPGPSWTHQFVVAEFHAVLRAYAQRERVGFVLCGPADVEPDPHTLIQPDVFVVPALHGQRPKSWEEVRELLLAVEVLSPGSSLRDRVRKRGKFLALGAEYWIVDADARLVERWLPGDERPEIVIGELTWRSREAREVLTIELPAFFAAALDC